MKPAYKALERELGLQQLLDIQAALQSIELSLILLSAVPPHIRDLLEVRIQDPVAV